MIVEHDDVLPALWERPSLDDIVDMNPKLDKSQFDDGLKVSFVPMPSVEAETGRIDVTEVKTFIAVKKGYTAFQEHDVLFAKITPCMENGKMAIVPKLTNKLGFGSTEFHVLRSCSGISPQYIYYYISSKLLRVEAQHNMTGAVGQRRVPASWLGKVGIPLPSSKEQYRIVEKIEELFSELDKGIKSLKTAREQLKVYRQALLRHAFEGKLTEQWRKNNADKLETADQLLARIQQERETRYQQQLGEWKEAVKKWEGDGKEGKKPAKPKQIKKFGIDEAELREYSVLNANWTYCSLGNVIDDPKYGTSKKCNYDSGATGVLRIPNIASGRVDSQDLKFADFDKYELHDYKLIEGDVLIIRSNGSISIVGKCALIENKDTSFIYAGYLIRLRSNFSLLQPKFLLYLLQSHNLRKQIEYKAKSTSGVNNINSGELQSLIIPIMGVEEQKIIVNELEEKLSVVAKMQNEVESNLKHSEALRQSILKKAFSGRLVSQDPNDEPAAELLKRIAAEKSKFDKSTNKEKTGIIN